MARVFVPRASVCLPAPVVVPAAILPSSAGDQQPTVLRYLERWPGVGSEPCWLLRGKPAHH